MALWPNNYCTATGYNTYSQLGQVGFYNYTARSGAQLGIHTSLGPTVSVPEGGAPVVSWVWPRTTGGMSGSTTSAFTNSLNLLSGGAMVGTASMELSPSGALSLIVLMEGLGSFVFSVPAALMASVLKLSGSVNVSFNADDVVLAIINPASGSFAMTFTGTADVRSKLSMEGVFTNIGEVTPDYGGAVYVADWGTDAFMYPAGTATQPVATLAAADAIAARYNLHTYYIKGSYALGASYSNTTFLGWGPLQFNKVNLNDQPLENCSFSRCVVEGQLNTTTIGGGGWQSSIARVEFNNCYLQSVTDLQGTLYECQVDGPTLVAAGGWVSAAKTVIEGDYTVFDLRATAGTTVSMDIVSGWAQFSNSVAGCLVELNVKGGEVTLGASCVGGEFYVEGVGTLFNESGMTVKENHLIWDEQESYHRIEGSTGESAAISKGLAHHNFILDTTVYSPSGVMTSGRIRLFPTAADTDSETNAFKTITLEGTAKAAPDDDKVDTFKGKG